MDFINNFPQPPQQPPQNNGYNMQQYPQSYTTDGRPQYMQPMQPRPPVVQTEIAPGGLGVSFSGLIGTDVQTGTSLLPPGATPAKATSRRKKKDATGTEVATTDSEPVSSKEIVESTVYADSYAQTNALSYEVIQQANELLGVARGALEEIRVSRTIKGKYLNMGNILGAMGSMLGTKLQAVREIDSNIKAANEAEYRRYKDNRANEQVDDNKIVMDAYKAWISAPVGAPEYHMPSALDITMATGGISRTDYPENVQRGMDAQFGNYISNVTPEENLMLHDNNPDIQEVIVYDQSTGAKYFQWMNISTGEVIPNMPISSNIILEDFVIDPRTRMAKNTNLNMTCKVVYVNEGQSDFSQF